MQIAWWRVALGLIFCLALAVGAALALRTRLGGAGPVISRGPWSVLISMLRARYPTLNVTERRLKVIETLRLTPQLEVCLFACDGQEILIAATPRGAFVVTPDPAAARRPS